MHWTRWLAAILLVPFTWITWQALSDVGYVGIFTYALDASPGWQLFADLVIGLSLVLLWMFQDARRHGRNVWPYFLITLTLGSFGPLLYLLIGRPSAVATTRPEVPLEQ